MGINKGNQIPCPLHSPFVENLKGDLQMSDYDVGYKLGREDAENGSDRNSGGGLGEALTTVFTGGLVQPSSEEQDKGYLDGRESVEKHS